MLDGRLLDIFVAPLFWEVMLGSRKASLGDVEQVYPEAFAVLAELSKGAAARYDPADLGLCMTLAGRDEWELVPGGAAVPLTRENVQQ